jgi:hypothetical protein
MVGSLQATSTERQYVSRVLPGGMVREIRAGHAQSAAAMTLSVLAAGVGYAKSTVSAAVSHK